MAWIFNPNDFTEQDFSPVPEGEHRVRIADVVEKTFRSGNSGMEVTFEVSGHNSRLWHYIVLDHSDPKKTNQRIGSFFESFGISDYDLSHYRNWIGKVGAVRVKHERYNDRTSAKVAFCLSKKNQEKLPAAQFKDAAPASSTGFSTVADVDMSELPF